MQNARSDNLKKVNLYQLKELREGFQLAANGDLTPAAALKRDWPGVAEQLIANGAEVDCIDEMAILAADKGYSGLVLALLNKGADPNAISTDQWKRPLLSYILMRCNQEAVEAALDKGAGTDHEDVQSSILERPQLLQFFIDRGVKIPVPDDLLARYAWGADAAFLEPLFEISSGINQNAINRAFVEALLIGSKEHVVFLLDRGADVNVEEVEYYGRVEVFSPPLLRLSKRSRDSVELVELLLDRGADINKANRAKVTPLMDAVRAQSFEVATCLIDRGADLDAVDAKGIGFWDLFKGDDPRVMEALKKRLAEKVVEVQHVAPAVSP